jgi:hypothetical protein
VVFGGGVEHRLRFCLDHLNCVKMATFQFYLQSKKQRKDAGAPAGSVEEDSHVAGPKIPW